MLLKLIRKNVFIVAMLALICAASPLLTSCKATKTVQKGLPATPATTVTKDLNDKKDSKPTVDAKNTTEIRQAIIAEARKWIGTPYRYAGNDRKGTDCSGLVMEVFRKVAGIALPRNSVEQCNFCRGIKKAELEIGDLIFFSSDASKGKVAHVGIYSGSGMMVHASSSKGVIESSVESNYYITHYLASGKVPGIDSAKAEKATLTPQTKEDAVPPPTPEASRPDPADIVRNAFKKP